MVDIRKYCEESTDSSYLTFNSIFTWLHDQKCMWSWAVISYFLIEARDLEAGVVSQ